MKAKDHRERLLVFLSDIYYRHPLIIVTIATALSILSIFYTINNLEFQTGRNDLISQENRYHQLFLRFREEFADLDGLVIVIEGKDIERAKEFTTLLARRLEGDKENFRDVFYKIDTDYFKDKALLYLSYDDLIDLGRKIKNHKKFIERLSRSPGLNELFDYINEEISSAMVSSIISGFLGGDDKEKKDPVDLTLIISILEQMTGRLEKTVPYSSPWDKFFVDKEDKISGSGFIVSDNEKLLFIVVNPVEEKESFAMARDSIDKARAYIADIRKDFPEIDAGISGSSALSSDEMVTTQRDVLLASIISLIGVTLLFIISFRGFVNPVLAVMTLIIAISWSLGLTTLTVGHLNVISVVFATILIGLGIDFGIHLIFRYQEEIASGKGLLESIRSTLAHTGKGIIAGAITTAFAFFTTLLANFKGIEELGFIAGTGILMCLIAMMTVLPSLIVINTKWKEENIHPSPRDNKGPSRIAFVETFLRYPKAIIFCGGLLFIISLISVRAIRFDYNILNLQAEGTESVEYEKKIFKNSERSSWYSVVIADSLEEARMKKETLEGLPSVEKVESIISLMPEDQDKKIEYIRDIKPLLEGITPEKGKLQPLDPDDLVSVLRKIKFKMREEKEDDWDPGKKPSSQSIKRVRGLISDLLSQLKEKDRNISIRYLSAFQKELFLDFNDKISTLKENMDPSPVTIEDLPSQLKKRFIGNTGKFLLQIFSRYNIWDRKPMEKFISDIRTVDPDTTGYAVQAFESSRLMKQGYERGGIYALIAIFIFMLYIFRGIRWAILAMVPLLVGSIWMIGLMHIFDLQFNLANLIVLPLIIGIGIDNGIHIVHRHREGENNKKGSVISTSTGKAVILSSLTTMIGFGSLMIASHKGIFSVGLLLTLGVGSCLIASLTVLPALLKLQPSAKDKF